MQKTLLLLAIAAIATLTTKTPAQVRVPTLKKVAEFDLPGPPGKRFDYLTIDSDDHYLISALQSEGREPKSSTRAGDTSSERFVRPGRN